MSYPFKKHDGGRSKSSHRKEKNDCTVRALALVTGASYDDAHDFIKQEGSRGAASGVNFDRFVYGVLDPVIGEPRFIFGHTAKRQTFPAVKGQRRMNPGTFHKKFPKGRFIVSTARHVYAVIDGVTYDLHQERADRCIYSAWEFTETTGSAIRRVGKRLLEPGVMDREEQDAVRDLVDVIGEDE